MIHAQTINADSRRIVDTYTLENNYRIKIYTYHDKAKHSYWSVIRECIVDESGTPGIYFERSRPNKDLNSLINRQASNRYSMKDLSSAHALALELGASLRDQHLEINADTPAEDLLSVLVKA